MPYFSPEVVSQARQMDLLTYLQNYEPSELVRFSSDTYCTKTHDSLKISNGKWCWFSRGIGGRSALDYLIKVKGCSFTEAVETILGTERAAIQPSVFASGPKKEQSRVLSLPAACQSNDRAIAYLKGRGIAQEVLDFCIETRRIYESDPYHNAVFVGLDRYGKPRYANLRGTCSDFKGEAVGSDKRFSFSIPTEDSSTLHLFESAIDLLSYASMEMEEGRDWHRDHLLSLAGIYSPKKDVQQSSIPPALKQYLSDHPGISEIILRLDNDQAGRSAAETLQELLKDVYAVSVQFPPQGKDYNDCLCLRKGLPVSTQKDKFYER